MSKFIARQGRKIRLLAFASSLVFASFVLITTANAEPLAALGMNVSYETTPDGKSIETLTPFLLQGGYRFSAADLLLEYSSYAVSDGTPMLSIARTHEEWLLWGRRLFLDRAWRARPYLAAGVGFYYEKIESNFGSESSRDVGIFEPLLALAGGCKVQVIEHFEVGLELRSEFSSQFKPNPMLSAGLNLGFAF